MSVHPNGILMPQITTRLPDEVLQSLEEAARILKRSRAEVIRDAIARYLDDFDDLQVALERLQDPSDPVLEWEDVKRELLAQD